MTKELEIKQLAGVSPDLSTNITSNSPPLFELRNQQVDGWISPLSASSSHTSIARLQGCKTFESNNRIYLANYSKRSVEKFYFT